MAQQDYMHVFMFKKLKINNLNIKKKNENSRIGGKKRARIVNNCKTAYFIAPCGKANI
jgi:hypothetical protein